MLAQNWCRPWALSLQVAAWLFTASWASAQVPPAAAASAPLLLQLLSPPSGSTTATTRALVHVMGRTAPDARVQVGDEPAQVFSSGIFVRDQVPLALGANTIVVQAQTSDGQTATQTLQLQRDAPAAGVQWPADRLALNGATLQPAQALQVQPGEAVEVALQATPGQLARARLPGQAWQPLAEASPGRYRASLVFAGIADVAAAPVQVELRAASAGRSFKSRIVKALTPGAVGQWRLNPDRLWAVGAAGAALQHGVHEVRLGGPYLTELPEGTLLHVTGQQGGLLRVQLAPHTVAWVAASAGDWAAAGTAPPQAHFTSLSVSGSAEGDVLQIPLPAAVPYAVRARADGAGDDTRGAPARTAGLEVDLYSSHHATTWISQRANTRLVHEVTAEQLAPGHVRLQVALEGARLWGWRVERTATALRIIIRPPPRLARDGPALAGLRVALEPGHGGPSNLGAVGATGTPEKDINRWTADALKQELEQAGAQVLLVRSEDHNPSLRDRVQQALAADAHVYLSVHANAADVTGGYLRVSGTSTYYKHAPSRALAAAVQRQLLQATGLNDFGLVGNFNYLPIRQLTWMPAVLVEQAFVSHPGDEAQLLDPAFRQRLARAVRLGLEDFLRAP